jgi:hypothetical protein
MTDKCVAPDKRGCSWFWGKWEKELKEFGGDTLGKRKIAKKTLKNKLKRVVSFPSILN